MSTVLINTYEAVKTLRENGFSKEQAEGVVEVIEQIDLSAVATKEDMLRLEAKIEAVKNEMLKWILAQTAVIIALLKFL